MGQEVFLIAGGITLIGWGLRTSFSSKKMWEMTGAASACLGLLLALLGSLLFFLPDFFNQ